MPDPSFLAPGHYVDSDHPDVIAHARAVCEGAHDARERASRLFLDVRETPRYDPYTLTLDPSAYRASAILRTTRAFCVPKAVLFCALARAVGIPARLGFADVRNHLASEKLLAVLNSNLFVFHGYVEVWIDGRPVKASPAFNATLCEHFGVPPLEFDGVHDALLQAFDGEGRQYMEYVRDRGLFLDLPFDDMIDAIKAEYGTREEIPPAGPDEAFE
ncbi:MAG: transglutaminase-like domain-containing protein [Deltaproteobacteria bacterium]